MAGYAGDDGAGGRLLRSFYIYIPQLQKGRINLRDTKVKNSLRMNIKNTVFNKINSQNGNVDIQELTDEILSKHPESKWDYKHWIFYKNQITSAKGRYTHLFDDEIKYNLKSSSKDTAITSSAKKFKSNSSPINHNFKFEDRTKESEKELSIILARATHFVHPDIIKKIVRANCEFKLEFEKAIHKKLNLEDYFFEGSDCLFPGTRRVISKEKGDKWKNNIYDKDGCILNDNTFPRHLWTYLCCNKMYTSYSWKESELNCFELAHLFSHKIDEAKSDAFCFKDVNSQINPFALFTSASNTVLIPKGLTKPTDKSQTIKVVFFKRYLDLYGDIVRLPSLRNFKEESVPVWYNEIIWNDPIIPKDWEERINNLLIYRNKLLFGKYAK